MNDTPPQEATAFPLNTGTQQRVSVFTNIIYLLMVLASSALKVNLQ